MIFNDRLDQLKIYPFQRLAQMLASAPPPAGLPELNLALGEPQHPTPRLVLDVIRDNFDSFSKYPPIKGTPAFANAAAGWLNRRFKLPEGMIDPARHVMPILGSKEALFMIATAVVPQAL